jgi:hypothetical protein
MAKWCAALKVARDFRLWSLLGLASQMCRTAAGEPAALPANKEESARHLQLQIRRAEFRAGKSCRHWSVLQYCDMAALLACGDLSGRDEHQGRIVRESATSEASATHR